MTGIEPMIYILHQWVGLMTGKINWPNSFFFINWKYHFDFKLQVNFMLNSKGRMILLWNNRVFQLSRINYAESFYNRLIFFLCCSYCRYLIMKEVIRSQQVSPVFYLYFKENFEFYFQYKELYLNNLYNLLIQGNQRY